MKTKHLQFNVPEELVPWLTEFLERQLKYFESKIPAFWANLGAGHASRILKTLGAIEVSPTRQKEFRGKCDEELFVETFGVDPKDPFCRDKYCRNTGCRLKPQKQLPVKRVEYCGHIKNGNCLNPEGRDCPKRDCPYHPLSPRVKIF